MVNKALVRVIAIMLFIACKPATADLFVTELSGRFKEAHDKYAPLRATIPSPTFHVKFVDDITNKAGLTARGRCVSIRPKLDKSEVLISKKFWADSSLIEKEIVLFHELGHCALLRDEHRNGTTVVNGRTIPISLMNERGVTEAEYVENRDYYLEELFFHY